MNKKLVTKEWLSYKIDDKLHYVYIYIKTRFMN